MVGCYATEARYALTQLRLGSKLPSLHNPLPHGRGVTALYPDADKVYMEKRIRQETDGTYGIENLEE